MSGGIEISGASISFKYFLDTEGGTSFDQARVQISNNGGGTWTNLLGPLAESSTFTSASASLAAFAGQTVQVRFLFDTIDSIANAFEGWYVDDVQITGPPLCSPNPCTGKAAARAETGRVQPALMSRLLRGVGFSSVVLTHGIYVPWGILAEVARQEQVHVSTWNVAYRKRRFIFSHDDTYHHTLMTEPRESWEHLELSTSWDQRTRSGTPVAPGRYTVRARLLAEGDPLEAPPVQLEIAER